MPRPQPALLLCFDFDGTLVNHEGTPPFHPAMGDLLRRFRQKNAVWVVNTGRSLSQTLEGLGQHHIFQLPDYIIARECEIYKPGLFTSWKDFGPWNKQAKRAHAHFLQEHGPFLKIVQEYVEQHAQADFLMGDLGEVGIVAVDDAELTRICVEIERFQAGHPEVGYHRNGRYLRFSHAGYSKGSALQELARLLQIAPDKIFAAGDNYNDLPMLDTEIAAHIACPGNALEPVKQHVRERGGFVGTKPASEGMVEALEHFFSRKRPAGEN